MSLWVSAHIHYIYSIFIILMHIHFLFQWNNVTKLFSIMCMHINLLHLFKGFESIGYFQSNLREVKFI